MIYNFNLDNNGNIIYEVECSWKDLKKDIKRILDSPNMCKIMKIAMIQSRLKHYENKYLRPKI